MPTSTRSIIVGMSNGIDGLNQFDALPNADASGETFNYELTTGDNPFTVQSGETGVTIIPDPNSEETITLKGITGDTGVPLNVLGPTSLALEGGDVFILVVSGAIRVKLLWT